MHAYTMISVCISLCVRVRVHACVRVCVCVCVPLCAEVTTHVILERQNQHFSSTILLSNTKRCSEFKMKLPLMVEFLEGTSSHKFFTLI